MSKTKFTKGEWFVGFNEAGVYSGGRGSGDGLKLAQCDGFEFVNRSYSEQMANAHLIKTAPKLYAEIESDLNDLRDRLFDADKKSGDYNHLAGIIKHKETLLAEARGE